MASVPADERSHQFQHGDGEERMNGGVDKAEASTGVVFEPAWRASRGDGELHHGNVAVVPPLWS
jgi:hypothetical protein